MSFQITGLDPEPFNALHRLEDAALAKRGVERCVVRAFPGAPCRISLEDASVGESVLLLSHQHQPAATPYRQQGPIFVRDRAVRFESFNVVPPAMARRTLSLRGYDVEGAMIEADLCEGADAAGLIERFFANPAVAYLHAHYARRGCFAALVSRAERGL